MIIMNYTSHEMCGQRRATTKKVQETEPSDKGYYELHFIMKCLDKEGQ